MPFRCGAGSTAEGTAKQRVVLEISCLYRDGIRSLGFFRISLGMLNPSDIFVSLAMRVH